MTEYTSDADEQQDAVRLGLLSYEGTHCKHGTFTGHWAGPDYLCFYCEMGVTDAEYAEIVGEEGRRAARRRRHSIYMLVIARLSQRYELEPSEALLQRIVRHAIHSMRSTH